MERLLETEGLNIAACLPVSEVRDGLLTLTSVSSGCVSSIISSLNLLAEVRLLNTSYGGIFRRLHAVFK